MHQRLVELFAYPAEGRLVLSPDPRRSSPRLRADGLNLNLLLPPHGSLSTAKTIPGSQWLRLWSSLVRSRRLSRSCVGRTFGDSVEPAKSSSAANPDEEAVVRAVAALKKAGVEVRSRMIDNQRGLARSIRISKAQMPVPFSRIEA